MNAITNAIMNTTTKAILRHKDFVQKLIFTQAYVKNYVHSGGWWTSPRQTPPQADIPPRQSPSLGRHCPPQTRQPPRADRPTPIPRRPLQQTVRILLECILVLIFTLHSDKDQNKLSL